MTGRARGRARGRGRASGGGQPEPQRRPGEQQQHQQHLQQAAAAVGPPPGGARSVIRGGTGGQVRPGQQGGNGAAAAAAAEGITAQMAQMKVGTRDAMREQRRDRRLDFSEPATKPAHVVDKRGTTGRPCKLMTNYFQLIQDANWHLYQYHVDYDPPCDHRGLRKALLYHHKDLIGPVRIFDGMVLFTQRKLQEKVTEVMSEKRDGEKVRVIITLTNELPPTSPECLHMYNVIFKELLKEIGMQEIGRQYYNFDLSIAVPRHKLEVLPGFNTAIGQFDGGRMLGADLSFKILRTQTVLDVMYELYQSRRGNFYEECTKKLVGSIVLTRYNNKTYRIDDISWDLHPTHTFPKRDGTSISYVDYFKNAYNIDVKDMEQPLLVNRPKARDIRRGQEGPIHLLPELCTMTGLTDDMRADFHIMKDIATHTRVAPGGRVTKLNQFIKQLNSNEAVQQKLTGWGLAFAEQLLQLNGRMLQPEKILLRGATCTYKAEEADWSRGMRGQAMISSVHLGNWLMLCTRRDSNTAQDFVQTIRRVAGPLGMNVADPIIIELPDDKVDTYLRSIKAELTPDTQLVMTVLPSNRKDRYDAIKKLCCVEKPVPSQVIVTRTISKKQSLMSVATKVAIQLNVKLGGEVWAVGMPPKKAMYIGIDTYHDSSAKGQSIGGVVCSLNDSATRYFSSVTRQHVHQELIDGLTISLTAGLKKYSEVNNYLPERIFVYRDGVGDGQLSAVYEHELQQLLTCFKAVSPGYNPRVSFTIVKKRINTRFFLSGGQNNGNPIPGTVVDEGVTKPEWFDYFLVSQSVRQGTVSPTHYNVIWDTQGYPPDRLQQLTYKMTHLYYNWMGTIRVPAPCQYAHKLAFLIGQSVHRDPSAELCDRLFYL